MSRRFLNLVAASTTAVAVLVGGAPSNAALPGLDVPSQDEGRIASQIVGEPTMSDLHIDFAEEPAAAEVTEIENRITVLNAATDAARSVFGSNLNFASGANDYSIEYIGSSMPQAHRIVITAVMEEWANSVVMNNSGVHVQIRYQALGGSALAGTQHALVVMNNGSSTMTQPSALYNANLGADQFPGSPDIVVYVNSDVNWSTVTSGSVPSAQYSLFTTMLHEIGHGLGFSSDVEPGSSASDTFSSFDQSLYFDTGSGSGSAPGAPVRTIDSPVVTTGNAWFRNLDATWERIYDPNSAYLAGSSMSHFDESTYPGFSGIAGDVMTPTLYNGESAYDVDAVVLGAMEAIGWSIQAAPATPSVSSVTLNGGGVTVQLSPNTSASAPPASRWDVVVKQNGIVVAANAVSAANRTVTVSAYLPAGTYSVEVSARGSGGSSAIATSTVISTNPATPSYTNCRQAPVNPVFQTTNDVNASVYRLYCAYFLRYPDMDGFNFWFDAHVNQGWSLETISDLFAGSPEFATIYGSLTNEQFASLIYENVLSRSPEPVGYAFWVDQLNTGAFTRGEVMLFFSQSIEFKILTGTTN